LLYGITLLSLLLALAQAGILAVLACYFSAREREVKRERDELLNRLLVKHAVEPIRIEREKVVKLPDPEAQPRSPIDDAFRNDDILEEIQHRHAEAGGLTAEEVREGWPELWRKYEERWDEEHAPLVIK